MWGTSRNEEDFPKKGIIKSSETLNGDISSTLLLHYPQPVNNKMQIRLETLPPVLILHIYRSCTNISPDSAFQSSMSVGFASKYEMLKSTAN